MDGSQLIHWTENAEGIRKYFGPRWTGEEVDDFNRQADRDWKEGWGLQRRTFDNPGFQNVYVWTPNGMRPR